MTTKVWKKMDDAFEIKSKKPDKILNDYVDYFWQLASRSRQDKEIIILPDGRVDLIFSQSETETFYITLSGIEPHSEQALLKEGIQMFAISFKLPAVEYLFQCTISNLLNYARHLPVDFW